MVVAITGKVPEAQRRELCVVAGESVAERWHICHTATQHSRILCLSITCFKLYTYEEGSLFSGKRGMGSGGEQNQETQHPGSG